SWPGRISRNRKTRLPLARATFSACSLQRIRVDLSLARAGNGRQVISTSDVVDSFTRPSPGTPARWLSHRSPRGRGKARTRVLRVSKIPERWYNSTTFGVGPDSAALRIELLVWWTEWNDLPPDSTVESVLQIMFSASLFPWLFV